jgi:hypothetical protein
LTAWALDEKDDEEEEEEEAADKPRAKELFEPSTFGTPKLSCPKAVPEVTDVGLETSPLLNRPAGDGGVGGANELPLELPSELIEPMDPVDPVEELNDPVPANS